MVSVLTNCERSFGFWSIMKTRFAKPGTSSSVETRVTRVRSTSATLVVDFEDGRSVHLPLVWYPRLFRATQAQRDRWELIGPGIGVHWPAVDEDLSASGLLSGRPSIEFLRGQGRHRKSQCVRT